ncbi:MAG TPA: DUF1937 family protein [Isosphaeraceae bacterium]|nr:DUF1937 family protein [Isosphaeraceae bacterium]
MQSREVVYIAGPFTHRDGLVVAHHCNAANALARRVREFGMVPFVPHTGIAGGHAIVRGEGGPGEVVVTLPDLTWERAMEECRELLGRADAVLMVEGWERSKGATEERALAQSLGIPVFETMCDLMAGALGLKQRRRA